ncbi:MAG: hypothetical protein NWP69_05395 [Congregibacter sp.]|nr:hypothetical protein [Congregibacter sp.]
MKLIDNPLHLGMGATAKVEPLFTGEPSWYESYAERHSDDGLEGRLVSMHSFSEPWDVWEMHPHGAEAVICIAGSITLRQEMLDGSTKSVDLEAGEYAVNEAGVWHTADVEGKASVLFITAGLGTEHRPRNPDHR